MKLRLAALVACAAGLAAVTAVSAETDPVAMRQSLMKDIAANVKVLAPIAQGKADFDAAVVKAALEKIAADSKTFPTLFPVGSDTGNTEASPKIWSDTAAFGKIAAKFQGDATAAVAAAGSLETFRPAFGTLASNCKACHTDFRIMK